MSKNVFRSQRHIMTLLRDHMTHNLKNTIKYNNNTTFELKSTNTTNSYKIFIIIRLYLRGHINSNALIFH